MYYIGLDVGGTTFKAGVVNDKGEILHKDAYPTGVGLPYQQIIGNMANLCKKVVADAGLQLSQIRSIGVGVPGIFDSKTGRIPFCTNMGWTDIPFVEEMHRHIDLPVYGSNDATVAGFAETCVGENAGCQSAVFLTLGTGVGGAIILNGRPYSGAHGIGSEIGHMIQRLEGEPCSCGNRGCFERYASATAIIAGARRALEQDADSVIMKKCGGNPEAINAKMVIDAAKEGDRIGRQVFDAYVMALAHGIVSIIHVLDPELILLGGGVSAAGSFLVDAVRKAVGPMVMFKSMPYARIELARLGNDAGIIGAAFLGKEEMA